MALIDRLRGVNDRLMKLPERFGDPRYPLTVMIPAGGQPIELVPRPKLTEVNDRLISSYLSSNVAIAIDDLQLEGISRSYDQAVVSKAKFILWAVKQDDGSYKGKKAEVLSVSISDMLSYGVVLRIFRER